MLHNGPTGPRANRSSGRTNSSRFPSRGGIHKQNNSTPRVDRDGDLIMGASYNTRGARGNGRGGRNSRRGPSDYHGPRGSQQNTTPVIDSRVLQQAIAQITKETAKGPGKAPKSTRKPGFVRDNKEGLDELSVKGLEKSMAAKNEGGGISELIAWLEQKASKSASANEMVKIEKSRRQGDTVIISVRQQDTPKLERLNGFTFAKAQLSIELVTEAKVLDLLDSPLPRNDATSTSEPADAITPLKDFLFRRYNPEMKFLDLSALSKDTELVNIGMFKSSSRESKFFPALMKVCDNHFTDAKSKEEAIVSVSLADNALASISPVTALAQTFPALKNLDLSNNQIKSLAALEGWRWKFRKLNHLVTFGNPIESEVPSYQQDILRWYPLLTMINNNQVRTQEAVESALKGKLPIPILPASFRDEARIGENFVRAFFTAYDTDRSSLIDNFYDANSTFSLSVNSKAPRALESGGQQLPGWDSYLKRSRNLKMITQLPAKMNRLHAGAGNIRDAFTTLPPTVHPNLDTDSRKWCIECHTIPGLPDLTGQSASGVGGIMVMVHGEFTEVDGYSRQGTIRRSFDRTFVLGAGGPTGIRVCNDILTLRQYGGYEAWQPDDGALQRIPVAAPPGFAMPVVGKPAEQLLMERMMLELSQRTGLTPRVARDCLELVNWSLEAAINKFYEAKPTLPKEAFISLQ